MRRTGQTVPVTEVWTTPHRTAPVDAVVSLPGSKSLTARALILAALASALLFSFVMSFLAEAPTGSFIQCLPRAGSILQAFD